MKLIPGTKRLDSNNVWWMYIGPTRTLDDVGKWLKLRITSEADLFVVVPVCIAFFPDNKVWKNDTSQKIDIAI